VKPVAVSAESQVAAKFPKLDLIDKFPGWQRAPAFLESEISRRRLGCVADLGGGANPLLSESFVKAQQLKYCVMDISSEELSKAPDYCDKIQIDITAPLNEFCSKVGRDRFDLVFSHMFLEHIRTPEQAHRNIHAMLRPGGIAVHFYPCTNNLPLALNRLIPEALSTQLLRIAQPWRDLSGVQGKFPAYYAMCGNPSKALHARFDNMGYTVIQHTGYIGHGYYSRFPMLREMELTLRRVLLRARLGLTSAVLLILQKR
jgi:SAM-dependent methyltransferase